MMGSGQEAQAALSYGFSLEDHVPKDHLLRSIDRFVDLSGIRTYLAPFYSHTVRPSVAPELMPRMLIVGYCFGIRSERRLCEAVHLNLAYRWLCRFDLSDRGPTGNGTARYRALKEICQACPSKTKCGPNAEARKITREEHEDARQVAREMAKTRQYGISMMLRKKVKMFFAHLKRIPGWDGFDYAAHGVPTMNSSLPPPARTSANWTMSFLHRSKCAKPDK